MNMAVHTQPAGQPDRAAADGIKSRRKLSRPKTELIQHAYVMAAGRAAERLLALLGLAAMQPARKDERLAAAENMAVEMADYCQLFMKSPTSPWRMAHDQLDIYATHRDGGTSDADLVTAKTMVLKALIGGGGMSKMLYRRVGRVGISIQGDVFASPELSNHVGETVAVNLPDGPLPEVLEVVVASELPATPDGPECCSRSGSTLRAFRTPPRKSQAVHSATLIGSGSPA